MRLEAASIAVGFPQEITVLCRSKLDGGLEQAKGGGMKGGQDRRITDDIPTALKELVGTGFVHFYPRRTILITEGEAGSSLYVLLNGKVKIYSCDPDGKEFVFGIYEPGSIFGEMALDGKPRTASVITMTDATCAVIPLDALRTKIRQDPDFSFELILTLIQRGRKATEYAKSLALESVYQRLTGLLRQVATEENGQWKISEPLSQQDIATRIGASRDMVSKIFKELTRGGYLTYGKRNIVLHKALPARW